MNESSPFENLLPVVREAGRAEMLRFENGFEVEIKEDRTPVTSADIAANGIILEALRRLYPEIPVVSEEFPKPESVDRADRFFLVDPLDGTSDFIAKRKEFTVNIALVENGRVVLGIVAVPALDELFYGFRDRAFKTTLGSASLKNAKKIKLSDRFFPGRTQRNPRVLKSVSHVEPATADLLRKISGTEIAVGSSLKFLRLAEGLADYYPRCVSLHGWDIAAGHGVLKAAGGNVYRFGTDIEVEYGMENTVSPPFEAY